MSRPAGDAFVRWAFRSGSLPQALLEPEVYAVYQTDASVTRAAPQVAPHAAPAAEPADDGIIYVAASCNLLEPCNVCMEPIRRGERIGTVKACIGTGIVHAYHAACIEPWWARKKTCPTCRAR